MARVRCRESADGGVFLPSRQDTTSSNFARQLESAINQVDGAGRRAENARALRRDYTNAIAPLREPPPGVNGDPAWPSRPATNTQPAAATMESRMNSYMEQSFNDERTVDPNLSQRLSNQTRAAAQPGTYVEQMQSAGSPSPGFLVESNDRRIQPVPAIIPTISPAGNYVLHSGPQSPPYAGPRVQYGHSTLSAPNTSAEPASYAGPARYENVYPSSPTRQTYPALRSVPSSQSCVDSMPHLPSISSTSSGDPRDYRSNSFSGPIQTTGAGGSHSFTSRSFTTSPPPPYANSSPTTSRARRRESYFALAEARSDQIIPGSNTLGAGVVKGLSFVENRPAYVENQQAIDKKDRLPHRISKDMVDHYARLQPPPSSVHPALRELEGSSSTPLGSAHSNSSELEDSSVSSEFSRLHTAELRQSWPLESSAIRETRSCSAFPASSDEELMHEALKPTRRKTDPKSADSRATRPAPLTIRRKPIPYATDTFKEVFVDTLSTQLPLDTLKEVANDSPSTRTPGDTLKEVDDALPTQPLLQQPGADTLKEFAPDSPVRGPRQPSAQVQLSPPLEPTSHAEMIRKKNLERKQGLKKPLRVVNA